MVFLAKIQKYEWELFGGINCDGPKEWSMTSRQRIADSIGHHQ